MNYEYEIKKLKEENANVCAALRDHDQRLKATKETLGTLIVWLVLELGEPAVDKLLSKLEGKPEVDGQNTQAQPRPSVGCGDGYNE